jgi:hypothetical protein
MNIFYFNSNPVACAKQHCDKHTVKMIVEYAQLLSTAHRVLDGNKMIIKKNNRKKTIYVLNDEDFEDSLYTATHVNHPSNKWVRNSIQNYSWLLNMWIALCSEYTKRYGKIHKSSSLMTVLLNAPTNIPLDVPFSPPWRAMPDEFKKDKSEKDYCEKSYQAYFNNTKRHIAFWKTNEIPHWFI